MKFVADDGKVFDTMEECEKYEANNSLYNEVASIFYNEIIMYDHIGQQIEPQQELTSSNVKDYLNELQTILNFECYYLIIPNYIDWPQIKDFLHNEYDINLPPTAGEWHWDDCGSNSHWESYEDMRDYFNDVWGTIGKPRIREGA